MSRSHLVRRSVWLRLATLVMVSVLGATLLVDWRRAPQEQLQAGDVAPRTVKAPVTFTYQDFEAYERQRSEARSAVLPVFVYQEELGDELVVRMRTAFANARALSSSAAERPPTGFRDSVQQQLERDLRTQLVESDVGVLMAEGFAPALEGWAIELLGDAMSQLIVSDRSTVRDTDAIRVMSLSKGIFLISSQSVPL